MEQVENNSKIEVVYKKAKLSKRMFAHFIDISLFILTTFIVFSLTNMAITKSGWYKSKDAALTQIKNDSGLYVGDKDIVTYVKNSKEYTSVAEQKDELAKRIWEFYNNPTYINNVAKTVEAYNKRRLAAKSGTTNLFIEDDGNILENIGTLDAKVFLNFYSNEINDKALGYLVNSPDYFYLTRFSFWCTIIQILVIGVISFTIYYLVLPLTCFKRGRQTIGMKLSNIGLITVYADNISTSKYIGRFFFMFFVFIPINFISFLIPSFVSIAMMFLSKSNSSLVNYVFNDYMVDIKDQKIYLDALERSESEIKLQSISIENKDLKLK